MGVRPVPVVPINRNSDAGRLVLSDSASLFAPLKLPWTGVTSGALAWPELRTTKSVRAATIPKPLQAKTWVSVRTFLPALLEQGDHSTSLRLTNIDRKSGFCQVI
jgi:hypothetical protein